MRDYLRRLSIHPGVPTASVMGALFIVAGLPDAWVAGLMVALLCWVPVLITALSQPLPPDSDRPCRKDSVE